jgi:hypothetical protein
MYVRMFMYVRVFDCRRLTLCMLNQQTHRVEDASGNVQHHLSAAEQPVITLSVTGPGKLIGLGSGAHLIIV